jgi:hypothetical protein
MACPILYSAADELIRRRKKQKRKKSILVIITMLPRVVGERVSFGKVVKNEPRYLSFIILFF